MSAKQCLRHDWLRDAPTQASPHLRRYLSKSREVLLERVVSRENLRRAALISQATSHANLTSHTEAQKNPRLGISLSQSEMCLNQALAGSRGSLTSSECYMSPADSQTSLNSSQTSLTTSQTSLATSQSYLLNKEQTQGLLSQAQSRSQANINHSNRRGLLSRMRSLNQIQSQACLLNSEKTTLQKEQLMNPLFGSRSQEKLYGLKCLSKSQGVLGIYRSLECIKKTKRLKKKDQRSTTEDLLPIFKQLGAEIISASRGNIERCESAGEMTNCLSVERNMLDDNNKEFVIKNNGPNHLIIENENNKNNCTKKYENDATIESEIGSKKIPQFDENTIGEIEDKNNENFVFEENLDSLQSVESDTLTEDSDETPVDQTRLSVKQPSQRQHSDISSHSNNSVNSDDKDEHSESEHDEPKYSVSQLVSAFNKHQEVASKTSLEAIMTEKRVNEVTFPTGPKALRLFIPDINISERGIVRRRKTSYKPRKNWEELRKRNEKNEGVLKDFNNDSGHEDNEEDKETDLGERIDEKNFNQSSETIDESQAMNNNLKWSSIEEISTKIENESLENRDTRIDEKYKQCVNVAKKETNQNETLNAIVKPTIIIEKAPTKTSVSRFTNTRSSYQKERLPNYIYPEVIASRNDEIKNDSSETRSKASKLSKSKKEKSKIDNSVNLKDILQKADVSHATQKENMEKLRKRTSIAKIILNDNLSGENDSNNNGNLNKLKNQASNNDEFLSVDNNSQLITQSENTLVGSDKKGTKSQHSRKVSLGNKTETSKNNNEKHDSKKIPMSAEERRLWGKVCTGSYTRAMEKFNGKPNSPRKSLNLLNPVQQTEKIRRKSSPAMGSKSGS